MPSAAAGGTIAREWGSRCIRISVADTKSPLSRLARSWPSAAAPGTPSIAGWDAVVIVNDVEVPFRFDVSADDSRVSESFFNGDERIQSTGGTFVDDALTLTFESLRNTRRGTGD